MSLTDGPSGLERLAKSGVAERTREGMRQRRAKHAACGKPTSFIQVIDQAGGRLNESRSEKRSGRRGDISELWTAVRALRGAVSESEGRVTFEIRQTQRSVVYIGAGLFVLGAIGFLALGALVIWSG